MKHDIPRNLEDGRIAGPPGYMAGFFIVQRGTAQLRLQISNGGGWDHVSVSLATRCPTWEEMCAVKRVCFEPHEVVMQLHPSEANYVNCHPFCLHLWRPQTADEIERIKAEWGDEWPYEQLDSPGEIPLPPAEMVGPAAQQAVRN